MATKDVTTKVAKPCMLPDTTHATNAVSLPPLFATLRPSALPASQRAKSTPHLFSLHPGATPVDPHATNP